jgi:glutathione S-transferase
VIITDTSDVPLVNVTDFSEVKTPQWLEKQPFGQMPYLEDGDFVVFESRAIAKCELRLTDFH